MFWNFINTVMKSDYHYHTDKAWNKSENNNRKLALKTLELGVKWIVCYIDITLLTVFAILI